MGSAIDINLLTGDIRSLFRSQKYNGICNFLRFTRTSHGDSFDNFICIFLRKGFPDLGIDQTRAYTVNGNSFCRNLSGQILGECQNCCFRCGIMCSSKDSATTFSRYRRQIDDSSIFLCSHELQRFSSYQQESYQQQLLSVKYLRC